MFHEPILVEAFLSFFQHKRIAIFIDGTLGGGGHAHALLEHHPEIKRFYGLDQDELALQIAAQRLAPFAEKVRLVHGNFRKIKELVAEEDVDGIFLDLGVSSMQLDRPEKGFSLYKEGPLDMRMDSSQLLDAEKVVNTFSEKELGRIFRELGEEPKWRAAAKAIVEGRKKKRIKTTTDLTQTLKHVLTWSSRKGKKIHPMTLVFQALRIFVNDELKAVEEVIPEAIDLLAPGGRLGVISFHSLEDRIVKHTFRHFALEKKVLLLTKKPLVASYEEVKRNPRSRSAKMRFVEKLSPQL
jgi:16S rRNA (cytosine1402-N4)-methyltransferase